MPYQVITHAGKAHIDEILAAALIVLVKGEMPEDVLRLNTEDVARMVAESQVPPQAWVVDCGLKFEPENRLFDHHQDRELSSAAALVFHHFFPELQGTDLEAYFELVSRVDTQGARSLDDFDHVSESRDYWGFAHQLLAKTFETDPLSVLRLVSEGLRQKIDFEKVKQNATEWASFPGRLVPEVIEGLTVLVYTEHPPREITDGLRSIDRHIVDEHQAVAVYGYDKNDASIRTLYRTDHGYKHLDFTKSSPHDLLFVHQGGFLMRFRPSHPKEWLTLFQDSILPKVDSE
ncbi:MAG: MYG1 family protein [Spirochaetales bacterium]|nr:MYG1 family protein [Spirochaetales bacterium]